MTNRKSRRREQHRPDDHQHGGYEDPYQEDRVNNYSRPQQYASDDSNGANATSPDSPREVPQEWFRDPRRFSPTPRQSSRERTRDALDGMSRGNEMCDEEFDDDPQHYGMGQSNQHRGGRHRSTDDGGKDGHGERTRRRVHNKDREEEHRQSDRRQRRRDQDEESLSQRAHRERSARGHSEKHRREKSDEEKRRRRERKDRKD
ncbi:uncharacterized protein F5Z01DRAFT_688672 [Emericellopsis atlantica]|uniref:Uncharacterized protein n=1 Tax=Emericellopsis atlantica TaxID=2614577 RepID=A0A9P8CNK7_9HYPO|nr:uncharacterized protein F5Z01DRAFT_688672 [Emericellopsis atlantica]KAG9253227.1 hypothetical protein F5Z01DRAFT_688672 [Emericellopsis atlantica]